MSKQSQLVSVPFGSSKVAIVKGSASKGFYFELTSVSEKYFFTFLTSACHKPGEYSQVTPPPLQHAIPFGVKYV